MDFIVRIWRVWRDVGRRRGWGWARAHSWRGIRGGIGVCGWLMDWDGGDGLERFGGEVETVGMFRRS